jgi:signal transduction histidine kinase
MTIRTRLTLWYSGMLLVSLLLMSGILYYELSYERAEMPAEQREAPSKQMADILFMYGAPTLLLLIVGGHFLMRRTLAPIAALTETAERIHPQNLRERVPKSGNGDELDRLATMLNAMLTRLDESFNRIREFTLNASHELKTPLTVMRGGIEEFLARTECTPTQREILAGHLDEIQRLARIVDNLSLLTKADAGLIVLEHENVRIEELVREAFDDACVLGTERNLRVELGACAPVAVQGDRNRLRQVLLNLIDNAVKYNEHAGIVTLSLRRDASHAVIVVSNTGRGIDPKQLGHVFERFFRGETARRVGADGSGLGLAIAQWIVNAHGGHIGLSSERGGMTVATVTLPLAAEASPETLQNRPFGYADADARRDAPA